MVSASMLGSRAAYAYGSFPCENINPETAFDGSEAMALRVGAMAAAAVAAVTFLTKFLLEVFMAGPFWMVSKSKQKSLA
jgi:hypothetical protein